MMKQYVAPMVSTQSLIFRWYLLLSVERVWEIAKHCYLCVFFPMIHDDQNTYTSDFCVFVSSNFLHFPWASYGSTAGVISGSQIKKRGASSENWHPSITTTFTQGIVPMASKGGKSS